MMKPQSHIADHMVFLYGAERAPALLRQLHTILDQFRRRNPQFLTDQVRQQPPQGRLTERDVILITYGDQVTEQGKPPLQTLADVLEKHVKGAITGVHLLPFFPYSSDDGFSVIDYTTVNPELGAWADIERLGRSFRLMFDAVINHISAHSDWFQEFLKGNPEFADYFIVVEEEADLSQVVRPRALPLLAPVQTANGKRLVWTTFSPDQIDLNYDNPDVLLRVIQVLLLYVEKGAEIIRLDAIAYLWKKIGTPSIHLEETHRVVKLIRAILDVVAPHVILITETNVPHEENISYFGDGSDEAQMVYQFSLPPLVLNAFHSGSARHLAEWAAMLETPRTLSKRPSRRTTFFNFLASHDGIGVRPVENILRASEVQGLVERTLDHGGFVSYKTNADGTRSVYELNISYFDALSDPHTVEPLDLQARRFLTSQAILLSMTGVPGIYVHSLFGSRSHRTGAEQTGQYRSINREKFRREQLERDLADPSSLRHMVFYPYLHLIRTRAAQRPFHPSGAQRVLLGLSDNEALFTLVRTSPDSDEKILCIHNVSNIPQPIQVSLGTLSMQHTGTLKDTISGKLYPVGTGDHLTLTVAPYQALWLKA